MLIINGCVRLGTDLFNHSKGLFFNRTLDRFSDCQYNIMSFHVQKWPDISNGWSDIGKTDGRKNRKKRKKKKEGKKKEGKKK